MTARLYYTSYDCLCKWCACARSVEHVLELELEIMSKATPPTCATPTMSYLKVSNNIHPLTWLYTQAYISSLVPNAPVHLNDIPVDSDVLVNDRAILNIGTCSFKFQYEEGVFSPLRDENGTHSVKEVR